MIVMVRTRDNREKGSYSSGRKQEGRPAAGVHGDNRNQSSRPEASKLSDRKPQGRPEASKWSDRKPQGRPEAGKWSDRKPEGRPEAGKWSDRKPQGRPGASKWSDRKPEGIPEAGKWVDGPKQERKPFRERYTDSAKQVNPNDSEIVENKFSIEDIPQLEGRNPIIEALKSGRTIEKLLVSKGSQEGSIRQIISMAKEKGIIINEVERIKLDNMSETGSHQGVIAIVSPYSYVEVEDIINYAKQRNEKPFIIILDEIHDPHNLGSIIRSADASGAHGVIISKRRAVGLTPTVAKASAGAIEHMKVAKVTNISQTIKYLKEQGLWIIGTDMDGQKTYYETDLTGAIAVVIGNEGEGINKLVKENCDFVVKLPMMGKISSLNAAVSGAVIMYDIVRQRILKG